MYVATHSHLQGNFVGRKYDHTIFVSEFRASTDICRCERHHKESTLIIPGSKRLLMLSLNSADIIGVVVMATWAFRQGIS